MKVWMVLRKQKFESLKNQFSSYVHGCYQLVINEAILF
jgi:hypothetical protein